MTSTSVQVTIKLLLKHLFLKPNRYLTQESFQSIRSIVFEPLFYVDINIFYDGSNDKTVICSNQIWVSELPSGFIRSVYRTAAWYLLYLNILLSRKKIVCGTYKWPYLHKINCDKTHCIWIENDITIDRKYIDQAYTNQIQC